MPLSMKPSGHPVTLLKDYQKPDYLISEVNLRFDIEDSKTVIHSVLKIHRIFQGEPLDKPLVLNGERLKGCRCSRLRK